MDCNKDEAIKARGIAEKKMELKDFVGAKKFVLKAQQLDSDLESIPQMLTICNVHCSAEKKLGIDMDWYGILQVELKADEASIKKQYRKLALLLHPDKNKLTGAEAAFKLIGEAYRVLSDRTTRCVYDMKYRAFKERSTLPQQRPNSTIPVQKQPGVRSSFGNSTRTQFTGVNLCQQNQPGVERPTFWTICPFCGMRYQYYRDILNRALRCQNCAKPFIAYDSNIQGVPSGANWTQPAVPQPKEISQDGRKMEPKNTVQNFSSGVGHQAHCDRGTAASELFRNKAGTSKINKGPKNEAEENGGVNGAGRTEDPKVHMYGAETLNAGTKKRKIEVDSSDSCDSESSNNSGEFEIPEDVEGGVPVEQNSGIPEGRNTRRSSRQKRQVIYNEDSDEDFVGPRRDNKSPTVLEDQNKASLNQGTSKTDIKKNKELKKQEINAPFKETSSNENVQAELSQRNEKDEASVEDSRSKIDATLNSNSGHTTMPDPEFIAVADPDFYNFDNDRKEDCFKNEQMWAVYDNMDGMPRFYARIRKVFTPGFKVKITWFEANPDDEEEIDWVNEDLPVSCGTFKHGKTETTEDINMFSHSVIYEKSARRGFVVIYPRKGEIWALFKNWDIKWSSDPDIHRDYEFEFVEVLSNYDEKSGINVAYLEKVKGFVSLFEAKKGLGSFQIPPNELYRFSHRVPSYRTTGSERDGVPERSFELDPASLPANLVDPKDM